MNWIIWCVIIIFAYLVFEHNPTLIVFVLVGFVIFKLVINPKKHATTMKFEKSIHDMFSRQTAAMEIISNEILELNKKFVKILTENRANYAPGDIIEGSQPISLESEQNTQ